VYVLDQLAPVTAHTNTERAYHTSEVADRRWQQTANYGFVPNEQLPKAFMASSIDLKEEFLGDSRLNLALTLALSLILTQRG
jgi:hypothetical protein